MNQNGPWVIPHLIYHPVHTWFQILTKLDM